MGVASYRQFNAIHSESLYSGSPAPITKALM